MDPQNRTGLLILLSAPSGGGKTTLCEQMVATNPNVVRAITCTTRSPRDGERDGVDYYFLPETEFKRRIESGEFLEHALVHGKHYGTLKSEVLDQLARGKDVLLSVDVQGARAIREQAASDAVLRPALVTVFITPATLSMLEERLLRRAKDSPESVRERLQAARREIAEWPRYDYLIISTSVKEDTRRMQAILDAETMRSGRAGAPTFD